MTGGRQIKEHGNGRHLANVIVETAKTVNKTTTTQVRISEIPLIDDRNNRKEIYNYNETIRLKGNNRYDFRLKRIQSLKATELLEEDGVTITDLGAERIAKDLNEQAMSAVGASQLIKATQKLESIEIARIIGRGGRNRERLEEEYEVHLIANGPTLIVKGQPKQVERAKQEINYQLRQLREDLRQREISDEEDDETERRPQSRD